ncbi:hypothetical protein ACVWZ3_001659 [Bradyrhizobium sp. i1.3.6]
MLLTNSADTSKLILRQHRLTAQSAHPIVINTRDGCLFSAISHGIFTHFAAIALPTRYAMMTVMRSWKVIMQICRYVSSVTSLASVEARHDSN